MKTYRELIVWQKAMDLVCLIYELTSTFPKEEVYSLTSQLRRASVSIPSNIAEGYGRNSLNDYIRHLQIAAGSLYEFQTQIEIAKRLNFLNDEAFLKAYRLSTEVEKMLASLITKLKNKQ
ncbi:four helix bundle protein [Thermophagus xiamenensis]|uniref:Four helix bundle protein n=1 Tax=Thermophagus xiamenensis TaxID=385682 RepID=A0A1I1UCL1_9BACT|nr:four helix bundle protein [Thermophagus xiamenensis]SFD68586.1 four helix bundle protein [Thermophagus xiamenensis]